MPSTSIASETSLLTKQGWAPAGTVERKISLFGSDRHGHLVLRDATLGHPVGSSKRAIIGTDASLGIFDVETRLILKDGAVRVVASIVEDSVPGELWFENVLTLPSSIEEGACGGSFITALEQAAPFVLDNAAIFRCRSRDVEEWEDVSKTGCCRFQQISSDVFCVVALDGLRNVRGVQLYNVIRGLSVALWRNSADLCEEFDCANAACCLWYASALSALKIGHLFTYDAVQHSLFVRVVEDPSHKQPFRRCKSAFYDSISTQTIRLTWESNSWTPIGSGFLLSGR
jgi:hypothetical protein